MIVLPNVLRDATAGGLVRFNFQNAAALAIVMRQIENGTVCAFLETSDEARPPFFMAMTIEGLVCMSYGSGWLLDLVFDANTFPGNDQYSDRHGVIHIGGNTVAINLNRPPDNIRISAGSFDLKTFKTADVRHRSFAPVTSWKIWATAAVKDAANAKPLFAFAIVGKAS